MDWCIIIPILVGLISALLGYLLGRLFSNNNVQENNTSNDGEIIALQNKIASLQAELDACQKSKLGLASDLKLAREASTSAGSDLGMAASFAGGSAATLIPFDGGAAKAVFGKKIKQDDLKIVEGIGPKIEGLFHNFDIKTWKALGETSVEKCQEVLNSGGDRYRMHKPNTWPKQAQLAYEGKWKELKKWQDDLDGGKA